MERNGFPNAPFSLNSRLAAAAAGVEEVVVGEAKMGFPGR